ncbi:MAG TPA: hypothetical protein VFG34_01075 [Sphingopyxis sp.]|nr:hypothetical protein [Sphingopyxis sp.]
MKRTRLHTIPNGLTPTEREIMQRWDDGMTIEQIAATTSYREIYVRKVLHTFSDSLEDLAAERHVRSASDQLLAAIQTYQRNRYQPIEQGRAA